MNSIYRYGLLVRHAWEDRREHFKTLREIARQTPEKWRAADRGQKASVLAIGAVCLCAIGILML